MKLAKSLFFSLSLFLLAPILVFAQNLPAPTAYVSDFAQVLSSQFEDNLNQDLDDFESQTGNQIAVVTVKSLDGLTVEEYSINLAQDWGIGQEDKDNGLLFLFAPNDRKVRIEVGYGLEHLLTDGQSGYILDTEFIPQYKEDDYEQAILNTVTKIKSELVDPNQAASTIVPTDDPSDFPIYLPFLIIFLIYIFSYLSRSKEFVTGGIVGLLAGLFTGGLFLAILFGIFGLILDFILSKNFRQAKSSGRSTGFRSTLGGFKSSGGSKSSGGGFGGFGGGSFGGGGSSRSL